MTYIGSKRLIAQFILSYIQKALEIFPNGKYIEPFAGGANIIDKIKHHTRIGFDSNKYLIALYNQAKINPQSIKEAVIKSRDDYNYVRANKDEFQDWYVGLVGLLTTFSSNWMGGYMLDKDPNRLLKGINSLFKQDLSDIQFYHRDYRDIYVGKGNVFYLDPPYRIRDHYKAKFNHEEFYDWAKYVSKDNYLLISEYYMPPEFTCIFQQPVLARTGFEPVKRVEKLFIYHP